MAQHELSGLNIGTNDGEIVTFLREGEVKTIETVLKMRNPCFKDMVDVLHKNFNYEYQDEDEKLFKEWLMENCGTYYHILSKNILKKEHLFRYAYLNTYTDYHGYIKLSDDITRTKKTRIVSNGERVYSEERYCKKSDIKYIFHNIGRTKLTEFVKYFYQEGMILEDDKGRLFIPNTYAIRGYIKSNKLTKNGGMRMFDNGLKEIYNTVDVKEHKKLDVLIKLIPYCHYNMNIICHNPNEQNSDLIERYTLTELAEELGYSRPQRLKDSIFNCKIDGQSVIAYTTWNGKQMIFINPKFYYRGSKLEYGEMLKKIFDVMDCTM